MLRCFKLHPNVQDAELCNDLNEMEAQRDVGEQEDVDVDAGRQMSALLAPADCFPPIAPREGALRGSSKARGLEPSAVLQMAF